MPHKQITIYGKQQVLACDGRCDKAWGQDARPKTQLTKNPDDYVYQADSALGTAPPPGGSDEGGDFKPSATSLTDGEFMNRWCARACERSVCVAIGGAMLLPDMEHPKPNIPRKS